MKITRIETIPIRVPLKPELAIKAGRGGHHSVSPFLLVRIHTDTPYVGLGEASCTPRWSGEDQVSAAHFINTYFAPLLIDQDPTQIESLTQRFTFPVANNYFTKSAVEMALWDLTGKLQNKPVYELLGGRVREHVATKWSVSGQPPDHAANIAKWAIQQGFQKMKVKVGLNPDDDVERVKAVRAAAGPQVRLGVDANGGYATPDLAIATIKRLRDVADIYFAEQPILPGDPSAMRSIREQIGIPLIADESVYTLTDAKVLARENACDVFSIYIGKAGGIGPARAIADFALQANIKCTIGSNLELGVGSAAMTHLALAHKAIDPDTYPCDIIGPFFYEDDIITDSTHLKPGAARATDKPGLGVELDDAKVEKYRVA